MGEARFRDAATELARLKLQAEFAWPQESVALRRHGLREDSVVLDAGCGPGFVTAQLLELVPRGSLTAIDVDAVMLTHAREHVDGSDRAEFLEASATETGLASHSFDIVLARLLLQHLPDAAAAVAEFRRVLRPGGRLVIVDADHALSILLDPEPPYMKELLASMFEAQRLEGGNPLIGRSLPRMLTDAGFSEIAVEVVVAHTVVEGREPILRVIPFQVVDQLADSGALSAELATAVREHLARVDSGDEPFDAMISLVVVSGSA